MKKNFNLAKKFINESIAEINDLYLFKEDLISDRILIIEVLFDFFAQDKKESSSPFQKIITKYKFSTNEFTNEKTVLTPEILGLLYENIHLQRKSGGVFYTPKQVALFMCRESINNFLMKVISSSENVLKYIENGDISIDKAHEIDNALSKIKVCDPAVGCGAFTVGMLQEISMLRHMLTPHINKNRTLNELKKHALENSIYGVDIDERAIDIAKKRMWLSLFNENKDTENIDKINFNLKCSNALTGEVDFLTRNDYFDIVIANPPYVGEKGNKDIFQKVKDGPLGKYYQGKMDLYYFFFHLALDAVKYGGEIALITTNYFTTAYGANKLRKDLKSRAAISKIINLNEAKIFDSAVGQHNMITFLKKGTDENIMTKAAVSKRKGVLTESMVQNILKFNDEKTEYSIIPQKSLYYGKEFYIRTTSLDSKIANVFEKIIENSVPLGKICEINNGVQTQADSLSMKKFNYRDDKLAQAGEGIYVLDENNPKDFDVIKEILVSPVEREFLKPFYKNSNISKYFSDNKTLKWLLYLDKNLVNINELPIISKHLNRFKTIIDYASDNAPYLHRPKNKDIFTGPKIIAPQRCITNMFGYNEIPWYASADVYFITSKAAEFDLKYILALLNSKLYYHWFYNMGKRKGEYLELYNKPLSEVPIIKMHKNEQNEYVRLVDKLIKLENNKEKNNEIYILQSRLDKMVNNLLKSEYKTVV